MLRDLKAVPGTPKVYSSEVCWEFGHERFRELLVMLREPRNHVLSQWAECDSGYDWMSDFQHKLPTFPEWVHAWAGLEENGTDGAAFLPYWEDDFGCYRPVDMQCQRMTCSHHFSYPREVNLTLALQRLQETDYVGIVEKYQESFCLFQAKMLGRLPYYCNCKDPVAWSSFKESTVTHGVKPHSLSDYSDEVLQEIDEITQNDKKLYQAGLERLRRELKEVESQFGVQVLCE